MTIQVRIEGAEDVLERLKAMRKKAPKATFRGLMKAALYVEGEVREVITEKFPEARTGELARSYSAEVIQENGAVVSAGVFSDLVYAGIQDRGGVIKPRVRKHLAVPLKKLPVGKWPRTFPKDSLTFIKSRKGNKLLVDSAKLKQGVIDPIFVLRESVKLDGKQYLKAASERSLPGVLKIVQEAIQEAFQEGD